MVGVYQGVHRVCIPGCTIGVYTQGGRCILGYMPPIPRVVGVYTGLYASHTKGGRVHTGLYASHTQGG